MNRICELARGTALIELAAVLPFLLALMLGSVEFTNYLSKKQALANISREAANIAFRDCIVRQFPGICTNQSLMFNIRPVRDRLLPGAKVIVSMYIHDAGGTPDCWRRFSIQNPWGGPVSRYDPARVSDEIDALRPANMNIIISEVFYTYEPVTPLASMILGIRMLYDSSIY